MFITFEEICRKEIINTLDGKSFGFANDILFDSETRKITAIIVKNHPKFLGIFGREEDFSIGWDKIETVGKDTILVKTDQCSKIYNEKESLFKKFLNFFLY